MTIVICLRQWRVVTDQMISSSLNCPGTDHLNEWFVADWIVWGLTFWMNDLWLIELSGDWPSEWMICGWLNCLGTDQLAAWFMANWIVWGVTNSVTERFVADWIVWGLTNWLNDLWLIEFSEEGPTAEFAQSSKVLAF